MDLKDLKELIAFDQAQFQEVIKVHDLKEQAILEFEKEKQENVSMCFMQSQR